MVLATNLLSSGMLGGKAAPRLPRIVCLECQGKASGRAGDALGGAIREERLNKSKSLTTKDTKVHEGKARAACGACQKSIHHRGHGGHRGALVSRLVGRG